VLERIYEAAGDLERYLRTLDSLNREVDWHQKFKPALRQRWRRANPWIPTPIAKSCSLPFGITSIHYKRIPLISAWQTLNNG
jgi:hypothetical protein